VSYRLLNEFQALFEGKAYLHRNSSLGDFVAIHLYEDLVELNRSQKLTARVESREWAINTANRRQGIKARRGDGTFGEIVPNEQALVDPGYRVARGKVATVEIGVEVKILAKAMIKQIDRVVGDLQKQIGQFKHGGGNPICVAVVGVNHAAYTVGYEGERAFKTDGKGNRHPAQEAAEAIRRLRADAAPFFNEFVILPYSATNEPPFPFAWVNPTQTSQDYGAALVRISREYESRFR
jgi:hypothetical protein